MIFLLKRIYLKLLQSKSLLTARLTFKLRWLNKDKILNYLFSTFRKTTRNKYQTALWLLGRSIMVRVVL
jgi:hypothetical protein